MKGGISYIAWEGGAVHNQNVQPFPDCRRMPRISLSYLTVKTLKRKHLETLLGECLCYFNFKFMLAPFLWIVWWVHLTSLDLQKMLKGRLFTGGNCFKTSHEVNLFIALCFALSFTRAFLETLFSKRLSSVALNQFHSFHLNFFTPRPFSSRKWNISNENTHRSHTNQLISNSSHVSLRTYIF